MFCSTPVTEEGLEPGGCHTSRQGGGEGSHTSREKDLVAA